MCDAASSCFADRRTDHQYFSDRHIDSGADADLCTQAGGDLFGDTPVRKLDHEQLCGVSAGALQ